MEKNPPQKSVSFSGEGNGKTTVEEPPRSSLDDVLEKCDDPIRNEDGDEEVREETPPSEQISTRDGVFEDVDTFLQILSDSDSEIPEVPPAVEKLSEMVDSMIVDYNDTANPSQFGQNSDQDKSFFEAVDRISTLSNKLAQLSSISAAISSFNRTNDVLQRAMVFLDDSLCLLLEPPKTSESNRQSKKTTNQSSFKSSNESQDRCELPQPELGAEEYPQIPDETVSNINRICRTMISANYDCELLTTYSMHRQRAFKTALREMGFVIHSIDDVQKMTWDSLEAEIATWINCVKKCRDVLFAGERKLADSVFSEHSSISQSLFGDLARGVVFQLLNFADAVALTKRSAEKLFKFLDMYEALRDLILTIKEFPEDCVDELGEESEVVKAQIGEAAVGIFCDLENSIKTDNGRIPVANGAVHPLTRYVMNYLKYACEYKSTLEQVFNQKSAMEGEANSRFAEQLGTVMDLLDSNLDGTSTLYKDPSLRCIFLMNNGRYILQKIKGSKEIHELIGDTWCRKRSSSLMQYHKSYQRETWGKILQCLRDEGLQINGKISKPVLKERFKSFNAMFDETHKTQSSWVVSDEQLQSELRVSISAVMIPAYRSFLARFKQHLDPGRQSEKYIKFQPEDIETMIEELFDGNAPSMARRKT